MGVNPKVSIIIPVYNGANYLREAIESALAQTYKNIEIIVVNDGSNDGGKTEEIAREYGNQILYFYKENGGVSTALNLGIEKMSGEYFSWLSHDDVYYPHKIDAQVRFLHNQDKDVILYSDYDLINENSRFVEKKTIPFIEPDKFQYALLTSYPIHGCTALIPKRCFCNTGLFNENLPTTQDYDMFFRLAEQYKFVKVPDSLIQSRIHSEQGSKTMSHHLSEVNTTYISFIKDLPSEKLLHLSGKTLIEEVFVQLAAYFRDQGLYQVSHYAFTRFKDAFFNEERVDKKIQLNPQLIEEMLNEFADILFEKKVILFGTGQAGEMTYSILKNMEIEVEYFVDNNQKKWELPLLSTKVLAPSELLKEDKNKVIILIASMYYGEIASQLQDMGFEKGYNFYSVIKQYSLKDLFDSYDLRK